MQEAQVTQGAQARRMAPDLRGLDAAPPVWPTLTKTSEVCTGRVGSGTQKTQAVQETQTQRRRETKTQEVLGRRLRMVNRRQDLGQFGWRETGVRLWWRWMRDGKHERRDGGLWRLPTVDANLPPAESRHNGFSGNRPELRGGSAEPPWLAYRFPFSSWAYSSGENTDSPSRSAFA